MLQLVAPNNAMIGLLRSFGWSLSKSFKPQPNDCSVSAQHIPTMLAQHVQAPAKRSQHFNATYRHIVGG